MTAGSSTYIGWYVSCACALHGSFRPQRPYQNTHQLTTRPRKRRTLQSFARLCLIRAKWKHAMRGRPTGRRSRRQGNSRPNRQPRRMYRPLPETHTGLGEPQHTRDVTTCKTCQTPLGTSLIPVILSLRNVTPASSAQLLGVQAGSEACCFVVSLSRKLVGR